MRWWCWPPALPRPPGCLRCLPIRPWPADTWPRFLRWALNPAEITSGGGGSGNEAQQRAAGRAAYSCTAAAGSGRGRRPPRRPAPDAAYCRPLRRCCRLAPHSGWHSGGASRAHPPAGSMCSAAAGRHASPSEAGSAVGDGWTPAHRPAATCGALGPRFPSPRTRGHFWRRFCPRPATPTPREAEAGRARLFQARGEPAAELAWDNEQMAPPSSQALHRGSQASSCYPETSVHLLSPSTARTPLLAFPLRAHLESPPASHLTRRARSAIPPAFRSAAGRATAATMRQTAVLQAKNGAPGSWEGHEDWHEAFAVQ